MTMLPKWATAPAHEKKVVATDKGWVVEETGEILVSYKNLPQHLNELHSEINTLLANEQKQEQPPEATEETTQTESDDEETVEETQTADNQQQQSKADKPAKRRGRKPKNK